jgi:hypothetical protein
VVSAEFSLEFSAAKNSTKKLLQVKAENTYLLALDGDIDFQAESITRLVDLMKKNKDLGAACGRIHPTGEETRPNLRFPNIRFPESLVPESFVSKC